MNKENWNLELSTYIKEGNLSEIEKTKAWETAIGLQEVDGLEPSKYLIDTAKEHIEGKLDIKDVEKRINSYYNETKKRNKEENNSEEADKVAVKITEILSDNSFNFSPTELINIHQKLFKNVYFYAGKLRDYNFTKKEWVLNYDTVIYASYENIMDLLKYDFSEEKNFSYKDLSLDEAIEHICMFTSNIWQIHPFCEGNTRTVAVFMIKYLKTFGFNVNDEMFAKHSWYFRNALVRANYRNFSKNISEDMTFLEKFFYNLLTDTNYELKNRFLHVDFEKSVDNTLKKDKGDYTLEEQAIINIIRKNSFVKQEEIAKQLNKSLRTVKTIMSLMQEKKMIVRNNGKRNGEWVIL